MKNLLRLSPKAIPTFLEIYKGASYPRHALTCSAFKNYAIQSEKYPEYKQNLELYTLNEDWKNDGLFLMKNGRSYYFDSLEQDPCDRVKKVLLDIDYSSEVVFRAVRDKLKPMLSDVLWYKNLDIIDRAGTTTYFLTKEFIKAEPVPT